MFGRRFFGGRYYAARYFGDGGTPVAPTVAGGFDRRRIGAFVKRGGAGTLRRVRR